MLGLDQNGVYLVSAFAITVAVLGGYTLYLWSRLRALRRRAEQAQEQAVQTAPEAPEAPEARVVAT
jgi:hypothetical protein